MCSVSIGMGERGLTDVDRLLRHSARQAVERLAAERAPVHPSDIALKIFYGYFHVLAVRARREELILMVATSGNCARSRSTHEALRRGAVADRNSGAGRSRAAQPQSVVVSSVGARGPACDRPPDDFATC